MNPGSVHPIDPGDERRMVHREHRDAVMCRVERRPQPVDPFSVEFGAGMSRAGRVEPDDPDAVDDTHPAEVIGVRPPEVGERGTDERPIVVVARQRQHVDVERGEQITERLVFVGTGVVDEIAGHHDRRRRRHLGIEHRHRISGAPVVVDVQLGVGVPTHDMGVGELRDQDGLGHDASVAQRRKRGMRPQVNRSCVPMRQSWHRHACGRTTTW